MQVMDGCLELGITGLPLRSPLENVETPLSRVCLLFFSSLSRQLSSELLLLKCNLLCLPRAAQVHAKQMGAVILPAGCSSLERDCVGI